MNDNYLVHLFLPATALLTMFAFFIVMYVIVQKYKQNQYQLEKSQMIYSHENSLLATRIEEQERVMDLMAREIHDNLGQQVSYAKLNMMSIAGSVNDARQSEAIEKTKQILDDIIKDIRGISHSLNSDLIKNIGMINMLQEELLRIWMS